MWSIGLGPESPRWLIRDPQTGPSICWLSREERKRRACRNLCTTMYSTGATSLSCGRVGHRAKCTRRVHFRHAPAACKPEVRNAESCVVARFRLAALAQSTGFRRGLGQRLVRLNQQTGRATGASRLNQQGAPRPVHPGSTSAQPARGAYGSECEVNRRNTRTIKHDTYRSNPA